MMRVMWVVCAVACLLGLGGCIPERVVWSPDGTRAAILGSDGLHICDANGGNLSPLLVPECASVGWLPDGKQVAVIRKATLSTWKKLHEMLPDFAVKDRDSVRKNLLAYNGDASKLVSTISDALHSDQESASAALLQLRDTEAATLQPQLGDRWKALSDLKCEVQIGEIVDLSGTTPKENKPLICGSPNGGELVGLRVSPTGKAVVFGTAPKNESGNSKEEALTLFAMATDGSTEDDVYLGKSAWFPDWSTDGRYLVYIKPLGEYSGKDEAHLGMLVRREIVKEQGKIWTTNTLPAEDQLVGLLYQGESRVRVTKDGRIFFVAMEVNLPTTIADIDAKPTLFSIQPGKQATVTRVIPKSAEADVGDLIQFFEVSPDMTRISIPFEDGRVSILDLATGKADMVQTVGRKQNGGSLESAPVWRSATELTFVKPVADDKQEIVLYSVTNRREKVLSATWPQEVRDQWLTKASAATAPATAP